MNSTTRLATIDSLLGTVPRMQCVAGCADCCGPVMMTRLEWRRILDRLDRSEKDVQKEALQRLEAGNLKCVLLDEHTNQCSVYDIRPAICRVFGVTHEPHLTCPHVAQSETAFSKLQTHDLLSQIERLGL